ncbi:energy-coupling factor transport system permease protein [Tumebacillus sp. BK434]|uniref:energy-coupling factor transporter transmembrane component T family protein n=1 Tax=Tumebacillus sp. BK434 TaxID=2512169 RepID=UPI001048E18A|nr:energy-coupling factor transporter transmembrane component T [Tumebacillus sp. BK434]TCP53838.1 energy-coupling factor transport system permease protein [Tumebacillus sp. BK434]
MRLERFHAATLAVYPLLLIVLAMITPHPLYLAALLAVTLYALRAGGGAKSMLRMMRFTWPFLLIILILNVLISKNGATVLYDGPRLPLFGTLRITLEAVLFGLIMALRLFIVLAACNLYIVWLSPDRALGLMAKWAGRSAVVAMLTARLIPYLSEQAKSVGEVMQTRGVRFQEGSTRERLQKHSRMLNVLLISSLEGSWQVAEAMEARGFGSRHRSSYSRERFGGSDWLTWAVMLAALAVLLLLADLGAAAYEFYPRLTPLLAEGSLTWGGALLLGALLATVPLLIQRRSN